MNSPPISIRLITRADDAGSSQSANLAVAQVLRTGVMRNASIMAAGPAFDHAVPLLREAQQQTHCCIGLHITLNSEWDEPHRWGPLSPPTAVPDLLDPTGRFTRTPQNLHDRHPPLTQMLQEVTAQLHRLQHSGLTVSYMDEHMGVGWLPGARDAFRNLAEKNHLLYGDARLPPLSNAHPALKTLTHDTLLTSLPHLPPGDYLIVAHPMLLYPDAESPTHPGLTPTQVLEQRDAERRLWTTPGLRQSLLALGVTPIRYDELDNP